MTDRAEPGMPPEPSNRLTASVSRDDTDTRPTPEGSAPMLDVHAPNRTVHTWNDFLIHIAAITIGLLMALGLEATVEWFHHRHQARQALELLRQELNQNRNVLKADMTEGDRMERNHREALAVLHRLRTNSLRPGDHLIFVRSYNFLRSSAWKVVHESGAAAYIPYDLMERYGVIYETQQNINEAATTVYADLQKATSVLNTEQPNPNRAEEDRIQREVEIADARDDFATLKSGSAVDETESRLSGSPDLSRLSPAQIDRLEQGFQQAITDDRRIHRICVYLDVLYSDSAN
jgi:hypothetical protein